MSSCAYQFGSWLVEPELNRITSGTAERHLEPLSMDILAFLLEHPNQVLPADQLLQIGWSNRVVESNAVPRVINELRQALGDDPRQPRYIQTIRKRGYRAIGTVEKRPLDNGSSRGTNQARTLAPRRTRRLVIWTWAIALVVSAAAVTSSWWLDKGGRTNSMPISSIAALPLTGVGLPEDSKWLTHGIASELTSLLSQIPRLRVASQTEAFARAGEPLPKAARELGVEGLLVGSLHRTGDGLEVKTELVASTGEVIWREAFRVSVDDPLSIQSVLAQRIFKYFGESNSEYGLMRPKTPEAYTAHLKRLAQTLTGNTGEELKWAEMAVALEPSFAMGHVYTVFPYMYAALNDPYGPWNEKARQSLDEAVRLGLEEAIPYKAHEGLYQWVFEGDLEAAEPLLRAAFIADDWYGRNYYARLISSSGIHEPLLRLYERLVVLEPHQPLHWDTLSIQRAALGDYTGAAEALERSLALTGENYMTIEGLVHIHLVGGDMVAANNALERMRRLDVPDWRMRSLDALMHAHPASDDASNLLPVLAAKQPSWSTLLFFLSYGDASVTKRLLDAAMSAPQWGKYWIDAAEAVMSPQQRASDQWRTFRSRLGYTDSWRRELCRRMATLPPETGLTCDIQSI